MVKYILFDLDGTLTDSGPGICKAAQIGLAAVGIKEDNMRSLRDFVGPPLAYSFKTFYGLEKADVDTAIEEFRKYYNETGIYENIPYPGIVTALEAFKKKKILMGIASSKPEDLVYRVLEHFDMKKYFDVIRGSVPLSDPETTKEQVMTWALEELYALQKGTKKYDIKPYTAMVGDRNYDIDAAKSVGVRSIGVTYGYGSEDELKNAGADKICSSAADLPKFIAQM